ncbi:DNA repair protein rad16 [Purpureocillium takamizusanense]|uniref:DNA repair protein rad16 n=1 Tax=Purpureocillium takamizusanense TaxID=2060973 RepID=A0A9Q8QHA6_9HYPO|nr:DNA repair protein rad16 [Purpureocillium takamizusanense]UNI19645.1 DNA repair protein rad16 [Purpureocillium takamizusanense]
MRPRRHSTLSGAATPASAAPAATLSGRTTRSGSIRAAAAGDGSDAMDISKDPTPSTRRPRGRPSKASLLAESAVASPSTAEVASSSSKRPRGRPSKASISSESASSVPTPRDASTDSEYSTPATSKVPTPAASENSTKPSGSSLEVRIPTKSRLAASNSERALRTSVYAMKAPPKQGPTIISDSDDEDFSDNSLGAQAARRLQREEYAKADAGHLPIPGPARRTSRASNSGASTKVPLPTRAAPKRARASTGSSTQQAPPVKKAKVIPDSDELSSPDFDMDAEIAAGAALESDGLLFTGDTTDEDDDYDDGSDDEPLMSAKQRGKQPVKPRAAVTKAKPSTKTPATQKLAGSSSQRAFVVHDSDSDPGIDEPLDSDYDTLPAPLDAGVTSESAVSSGLSSAVTSDDETSGRLENLRQIATQRRGYRRGNNRRLKKERNRLETHHPELSTMWTHLESMPVLKAGMIAQPSSISRQLKPFQLEGVAWMKEMEKTEWRGGLLGDEMGLGKTIQAVSLIMSDYPAKQPSLVLVPPVALMQWQSEIKSYTDGTLKTFVFHGTNQKAKSITVKELKQYDVIMMSYNSLESMYRKQERGFKRKNGIHKEQSVIHSIHFHRIILDEAHCIKTRTTMTAKACFALKTSYRWCLTGTPLQNRIGEFFSLIRFLNIKPFASYLCKQCPCSSLEWTMNDNNRCNHCNHAGMQHVSVFNQELLNPIQKFGNLGPGREAFRKLRLMTDRIMLRRLKKDHTNSMELPVKEIYVDRQFFGEEENDFANSIMTNGQRKFDTYVAQGVLLNNYANIFGLIMQMRQVADHPDLILKKNAEGGQNVMVCCICDEPAEDTVRSRCKHDFCRACVASYVRSTDEPDCPRCHIPLAIDLEQPEIEQDETLVKKNSIINRIKMENWTSSSKIELLVHQLHQLRSDNATHKSIIFSQFTTMLQLIEWRLRRAGITTVMLDGSMTPAQRQASIEHFMNNVDVECFLVSLKAGGVALNLTEASRVFIVDPWWNPAAEWQSADRCHRIGQTRPCTITRLCIEDSVESRMVLIQEKKTNMIHSTVNGDDKAMDSLSPEDMQFLFRGS